MRRGKSFGELTQKDERKLQAATLAMQSKELKQYESELDRLEKEIANANDEAEDKKKVSSRDRRDKGRERTERRKRDDVEATTKDAKTEGKPKKKPVQLLFRSDTDEHGFKSIYGEDQYEHDRGKDQGNSDQQTQGAKKAFESLVKESDDKVISKGSVDNARDHRKMREQKHLNL
jgi:hypothetical protein